MSVLMENAGQVVSRASLFLSVWGLDFDPGTKVLEVQLSYVRSTLRLIGSEVTVHTLRGRGLRLHDQ
ncbi:TPA: winged helix-turn-helix transcriptional regulator [Pseudomonas putida]|nr:winged helix-turn-helix transcriptional regulator [Pseudomonas putida]